MGNYNSKMASIIKRVSDEKKSKREFPELDEMNEGLERIEKSVDELNGE